MSLDRIKEYGQMSFGQNLRRLRNDKGYTQTDLAKHSGVRSATISQIEQDEGDPKLSTVNKLISALGCSPDSLMLEMKDVSLDAVMKTMIERASKLPEQDKLIVMDVMDTYCRLNGFNEVVDQGWRKFAIITKSDRDRETRLIKQIEE